MDEIKLNPYEKLQEEFSYYKDNVERAKIFVMSAMTTLEKENGALKNSFIRLKKVEREKEKNEKLCSAFMTTLLIATIIIPLVAIFYSFIFLVTSKTFLNKITDKISNKTLQKISLFCMQASISVFNGIALYLLLGFVGVYAMDKKKEK